MEGGDQSEVVGMYIFLPARRCRPGRFRGVDAEERG